MKENYVPVTKPTNIYVHKLHALSIDPEILIKQGPDLRYLRWAIWRGGHFLAWTHFVELNMSRCFFANQNSLAEDEETIQIFSSKLF